MDLKRISLLIGLGLVIAANATFAAPIGTDTAAAPTYDDGWQDADDGSITGDDAFAPWSVFSAGTQFAGVTVEDSTDGGSDLNTDSRAFGLYADSADGTAYAHAYRYFGSALEAGQTFSIDLKANFRSGFKGIEIRDDQDVILKFIVGNVGNGDDYTIENATTGAGSIGSGYSSDSIFNLTITQTSATGGTWTLTRSGGISDIDTGTYTGVADNFKLFAENAGGGAQNNLWVNNLQIVPEPGATSLLGLGFAALFLRRRGSQI